MPTCIGENVHLNIRVASRERSCFLFYEIGVPQVLGALLYPLELGPAFLVAFQFHVVTEDTYLVSLLENIREIHHTGIS